MLEAALHFVNGVDDVRPLLDSAGNPDGYLFILRHFQTLMELRNWKDVLKSLSFEDDRLGVKEEDDCSARNYMKTTISESPKGKGAGGRGGGRGRGKGRGRGRGKGVKKLDFDPEETCHGGFERYEDEDDGFGGFGGGGSSKMIGAF